MNVSKEAMAVLGGLVGLVIILTLVGGGTIGLGAGPTGPTFGLNFTGPYAKK